MNNIKVKFYNFKLIIFFFIYLIGIIFYEKFKIDVAYKMQCKSVLT